MIPYYKGLFEIKNKRETQNKREGSKGGSEAEP
jgi:hypothetical protein